MIVAKDLDITGSPKEEGLGAFDMKRSDVPIEVYEALSVKIADKYNISIHVAHDWLDDVLESGPDSRFWPDVYPVGKKFFEPIIAMVIPAIKQIFQGAISASRGQAHAILHNPSYSLKELSPEEGSALTDFMQRNNPNYLAPLSPSERAKLMNKIRSEDALIRHVDDPNGEKEGHGPEPSDH